MKLYDTLIGRWDDRFSQWDTKSLSVTDTPSWKDVGSRNMILRQDMAYELGGSTASTPALGGTAVTDSRELVPSDEILLIGPDLGEIHADTPYARLAIARISDTDMGEGNRLYNAIRRIEYVRYHVDPDGFMIRISSLKERECVRVSRDAIAKGISFEKVGNLMLRAFHENAHVEAVKLIFITDPAFPYKELEEELRQAEAITKTIDHITKNLLMDCDTCSLQKVCDEVEGMKELHFGQGTVNLQDSNQ